MKPKYYTLDAILKYDADYNVIYGERSNGKTTAVLKYGLEHFIKSGYQEQFAIVRRYEEDYKGKNGQQLFDGIIKLGWIEDWTDGLYNSIYYYSQKWYLVWYDEDGDRKRMCETPVAFGFAITSEEHYKSTAYPNVKTILFDEFITRSYYLPEEFVKFQNLLSTIIRLRDDVKIFMCGNTINKYCPYFTEMGIKEVRKQKKGTIDLYTYGESTLKVAVEYSDFPAKKKPSNKYFAFNNPKLNMITHGGWEMDIYPHMPCRCKPSDYKYKFYILFDDDILQGNIIFADNSDFLYIHRKTTPIKEDNRNLVYSFKVDHRPWYRQSIMKPYGKVDTYIFKLVNKGRVFYQDNEVGEIMNNYFKECP